ncbi:hypothetical protein IVB18_05325 [Bradyrhizobium sp. 186]|uniref:hypothetical protein n=1 Tax=Bradyrhizobium sp. 186 TaxID=2782654 RepID=UPI0020010D38|nr:hypothetical protein [Bradyrhizobium sp. 186]UPK31875.1 hypothetical protein IVB18_26475 [Bradyrhizobium sp. 186]UPK36771.1 hypothetical protein IVB18_05325 [Bradyrhizobium sp. 186]
MTGPVRINLASLTPDDIAKLREMLRTQPGQRRPETLAAIAERDRLIRALAITCFADLCRHQQSVRIHDALVRYAATTWVRARVDVECRHADHRRRLLWQILKTRGGHVPAVRTIDDILAGCD